MKNPVHLLTRVYTHSFEDSLLNTFKNARPCIDIGNSRDEKKNGTCLDGAHNLIQEMSQEREKLWLTSGAGPHGHPGICVPRNSPGPLSEALCSPAQYKPFHRTLASHKGTPRS